MTWVRRFFLQRGYRFISADQHRFLAQLRAAGRPCVDPGRRPPQPDDLDQTARWVIEQAVARQRIHDRISRVSGRLSSPVVRSTRSVRTLRLAQRLAWVYGHDLERDTGRVALWNALSEALSLERPEGLVSSGDNSVEYRLFTAIRSQESGSTRWLPGKATDSASRLRAAADIMQRVFRGMAEPMRVSPTDVVDITPLT